MTNKEKLLKVLQYCREMEDTYYDKFSRNDVEVGSQEASFYIARAAGYQDTRYLIEQLLEEE